MTGIGRLGLELRRAGWSDSGALLAVLIVVVLPNIVFLAVAPWLLIRRVVSPLLYVLAAVLALLLPRAFALPLFFVAAAMDVFFIVSFMFDLPPDTSFRALRFVLGIDLAASALYVGAAAYFIVMPLALALLFSKHRARLKGASFVPAMLAAFGVAITDYASNGARSVFAPPFESALAMTGMTSDRIVKNGRSLLVVMVEGLGAFSRDDERVILADRLTRVAGSRFELSSGTSAHFGSTTGATSREFCGRWETFDYYLGREDHDCLPNRLAAVGYHTAAYHGYSGELFSRRAWYPHLGFQQLVFLEDLEDGRRCGSVFRGLCDDVVGNRVKRDLLRDPGAPKMLYWLTLNSHLPYEAVEGGPLRCRTAAAAIPSAVPCELAEIWSIVFDKVAEIAAAPDLPSVDILVVGDHGTPMLTRDAAAHFIPGRVDWYLLEDRRPPAVSPAAASG